MKVKNQLNVGPFCSCPPIEVIKDLFSSVERVTLYGFLIGLAKHPGVNESTGKLGMCSQTRLFILKYYS